ncbi:bifunctional serine/threonine-protein kinase/formylglycine-generating enzyme family protein [Engelhardtia mirabilis]|uniref:Serine/threonine-protein kinase pkn6 n=1 Tax=Engelhardtia mirabilis TaxID=2528011 RepID=A0A518BFP7_9BACT|nr:Serine/threonine-protein kinase pkn6 [Planctomycetes bacterium Pla133]QDV00069.1 Serine/threonine-protein kinase pkn6 [Planctomycetes bacterium Pla86]
MSNHDPDPPPSPQEQLLHEFLEAHPHGRADAFEDWAAGQQAAGSATGHLDEVRALLAEWRAASELIAKSIAEPEGVWNLFDLIPAGGFADQGPLGRLPSDSGSGDRRVSHFTLERFIARGGMGQVWEALDSRSGETVALKLVLPERLDDRTLALFAREARAGAKLDHPNVVKLLGYGSDGGMSWIAQEFVPGAKTLKDFIAGVSSGTQLPSDYHRRVADLVARVADGLHASHGVGVIHRDVKPANILIAPDGTPRLTDFGLARVVDDSFDSVTGDFAGTWAYMSPEQVTAKRMGLDHRTDIFSLGVVLYELLALRRPFEGDTTHQIAQRIVTYDPPDPSTIRSQCPSALATICGKALEKDPDRRYGSCAAFADDLREYLSDRPIAARPPSVVHRLRRWAAVHPVASSVTAVVTLALISVTVLLTENLRTNRLLRSSNADLAEQRDLAEANAAAALAAQSSADQERQDVLRLSALQDLDLLLGEVDELWPATPERIPALRSWIERAERLVDDIPLHRLKRSELRTRALEWSQEQRLADRSMHPALPQLVAIEAELASKRFAYDVRRGLESIELPPLEEQLLPQDADAWSEIAWTRVRPSRDVYGRELEGLAIASGIREQVPVGSHIQTLRTLAWARFSVGDDDGALAAIEEALAHAEGPIRADIENHAAGLQVVTAFMRSEEGLRSAATELEELASRRDAIEATVGERLTWEFPGDGRGSAWWNDQLSALIDGLEQLEASHLNADAAEWPHGWSVARRLAFAERTARDFGPAGPYSEAWSRDLAAIRAAYSGLELEPQLGLVPLGADPDSGLWEFAHLASGLPPERGADGRLQLDEESSIVLVLVPEGSFTMGAQQDDPAASCFDPRSLADERPVHSVELSAFMIAKHETAQSQWERLAGWNPSSRTPANNDLIEGWLNPVEQVTWNDAYRVLLQHGLELPTEARWERACRAGTTTPTPFPEDEFAAYANVRDQSYGRAFQGSDGCEAWDDGHGGHAPVDSMRPNGLGLHHMLGNVWEWCLDGYDGNAYRRVRRKDPFTPPDQSPYRHMRGGSYYNPTFDARASFRPALTAESSEHDLGVRAARSIHP